MLGFDAVSCLGVYSSRKSSHYNISVIRFVAVAMVVDTTQTMTITTAAQATTVVPTTTVMDMITSQVSRDCGLSVYCFCFCPQSSNLLEL